MLKVRGEVLGKVVLGARIECHKEMAKVLNYEILNSTSAKSIIMSSYIDVCEAAYNASKKAGFNPVKIYGEETKNQTANISKFIEDDKTDPAIGTYKSISTGHHLVVADLVLLMDVPFRTYTLDQAIARVYRMGQKNIVHILYTKLDTGEDYNINSRNIDILKWAKDAVEEITGNTIKGLDFDKGKEIANDIAAGLENDVKGDWGKIKENRNKENNGKEDCSEQESSKKASRYMTTYAYQMDQPSTHKKADIYVMGVSELCALPDGQLLVLEREAFIPKIKIGAFCKCKLYQINPLNSEEFALKEKFSSDTPFLKKRLLAEWKTGLSLSKRSFANYEGMCLGPKLEDGSQVVILLSDSQDQYAGVLKDWFKTIVIRKE
jgi:hypothetical protein